MRYLVCLLLMMLCASSAKGACLDWSHTAGNPDYRLIYFGTLGDHPIRMMLHLDPATGRFDGAYGYNNQPDMLVLSGSMQPGGAGADLDERDAQGHVTGHFNLKFFLPHPAGEDPAIYAKYPSICDALTGKWQSPSGDQTQDVAVRLNGEIAPINDGEREMNEIAAYKLRQAMLDKNRPAFASLLKYPFYTSGFHRPGGAPQLTEKNWNSPKDVIKNYSEIVQFSHDEIWNAVPHILETSSAGSDFMSRSIEVAHGKITRICQGPCQYQPETSGS